MTDIIEHAKYVLDGVTGGPWVVRHLYPLEVDTADGALVCRTWTSAEAAFIAASRTLVPALVAEVERLRAEQEKPHD